MVPAIAVLVLIYVFQRVDFFSLIFGGIFEQPHAYARFSFNRAFRMIVNDIACLCLIWVWFPERKFIRLAGVVFLIEVFIILPVYLWIKLSLEGDSEISSPWLSQVHRLIVNPLLMILLMIAFLYQRKQESMQ